MEDLVQDQNSRLVLGRDVAICGVIFFIARALHVFLKSVLFWYKVIVQFVLLTDMRSVIFD